MIRAPGEFGVGSWRTSVLLEAGDYQFVGKVRTEGVAIDLPENRTGVTLRISGSYQGKMVSDATNWTSLTYDFTIPALEYVELVCELRASQGTARFAVDSLKLIRKGKGDLRSPR